MNSEEHNHTLVHEEPETEEDKESLITQITQQLDFYKSELASTQAHEQAYARELIAYLIMERDAMRNALQNQ